MVESLRDVLPAVYGRWLPEFFDRPTIAEPRSTCLDCVMCGDRAVADVRARRTLDVFRPDVKCCTWHPDIPNYLVGAALRDGSPALAEGRARLRLKVAGRTGVTPLQLARPPRYTVLYNFLTQSDAAQTTGFGTSEELVCPYLDRADATCTVWPYRERICTTWFCKVSARAAGYAAWQALKEYLGHVEYVASRYAAERVMGARVAVRVPSPAAPLPPSDLAGERTAAEYAAEWGAYVGREEEFYVACAEVVEVLAADDIADLLANERGSELLATAVARYDDATSPRLAPRLVLRRDRPHVVVDGGVRVATYHRFDPVVVDAELYALLDQFSADLSTIDNLARLAGEGPSPLTETVLLELQVYGVMVAPG